MHFILFLFLYHEKMTEYAKRPKTYAHVRADKYDRSYSNKSIKGHFDYNKVWKESSEVRKKKKPKNIWFTCYSHSKATWKNKDYILWTVELVKVVFHVQDRFSRNQWVQMFTSTFTITSFWPFAASVSASVSGISFWP